MAFPTTSVLDSFGQANEDPLSSSGKWSGPTESGHAQLQVTSNTATGHSSGSSSSWWNVTTFGPDTEAYITISTKGNTGATDYLWINLQTPGTAGIDGYFIAYNYLAGTDTQEIYRIDNDGFTRLGAAISTEYSAGDGLGVDNVAGLINVYRNNAGWASVGNRSDSTYGTGYIGLGADRDVERLDDFGGGTVTGGGGGATTKKLSALGVG